MKILVGWTILIAVVFISLSLTFGTHINENERGIRCNRSGKQPGIQDLIIQPGITWRIPFLSTVQKIPVNDQSFLLRNRRHAGPNPYRNALYIKSGDALKSLNVEVHYRLPESKLLDYARTFFGTSPKIIAEGTLRIMARNTQYETIQNLAEDVNKTLAKTGITLVAINPLDRKTEEKIREKQKTGNKKRKRE